jgi:hypothetical protein
MFPLDRSELKGKGLTIVDIFFNWGRGRLRGNTAQLIKIFQLDRKKFKGKYNCRYMFQLGKREVKGKH